MRPSCAFPAALHKAAAAPAGWLMATQYRWLPIMKGCGKSLSLFPQNSNAYSFTSQRQPPFASRIHFPAAPGLCGPTRRFVSQGVLPIRLYAAFPRWALRPVNAGGPGLAPAQPPPVPVIRPAGTGLAPGHKRRPCVRPGRRPALPPQKDKGSDEPDPCAGARLRQQTFPLGAKCASPGGFCFIGRNFL